MHAVHGNVDEPQLRRTLPAELTIGLGDRKLALGERLRFEHVWL